MPAVRSAAPPSRALHTCSSRPTCSSPDSKKDFLKAVHSILREKQRRQLLKTESLPRSQQYVPFGGKRLCALKGARPTMSRAGDEQSSDDAHLRLVLSVGDVTQRGDLYVVKREESWCERGARRSFYVAR